MPARDLPDLARAEDRLARLLAAEDPLGYRDVDAGALWTAGRARHRRVLLAGGAGAALSVGTVVAMALVTVHPGSGHPPTPSGSPLPAPSEHVSFGPSCNPDKPASAFLGPGAEGPSRPSPLSSFVDHQAYEEGLPPCGIPYVPPAIPVTSAVSPHAGVNR